MVTEQNKDVERVVSVQKSGWEAFEVPVDSIEAARAEARAKVSGVIAGVSCELFTFETTWGVGIGEPPTKIRKAVDSLTAAKDSLEEIAVAYGETLAGLERQMVAARSLVEEVGVAVDFSKHDRQREAVTAQQSVVDDMNRRITAVLDNSEARLEKMRRDYAVLYEFAGAIGSTELATSNPLVQCVLNFDNFPFGDWLREKMAHPRDFIEELKKTERTFVPGDSGEGSLPSVVVREMVSAFNSTAGALRSKYYALDEGFKESAEIAALRGKLAMVPNTPEFEALKKATDEKIQQQLEEEREVYMEAKKETIDGQLKELHENFVRDIRTFARQNLAYLYVKNMLDGGEVKRKELCEYVAENISKGSNNFPYFLLPKEVVDLVVEKLSEVEMRRMFANSHTLIFTEQFAERESKAGLGDGQALLRGSLYGEREMVAAYLRARENMSAQMLEIDEVAGDFRTMLEKTLAAVRAILANGVVFETKPEEVIVTRQSLNREADVDAQIREYEVVEIRRLDERARELQELQGSTRVFAEKATSQGASFTGRFAEVRKGKDLADQMAATILTYSRRPGLKSGVGDPLVTNLRRGNEAFLQSFSGLVDADPRKFADMVKEFEGLDGEIESKLAHLKTVRDEKEKFRQIFQIIVAKVRPTLWELGMVLRANDKSVEDFLSLRKLLEHQEAIMRDFKDVGGNEGLFRNKRWVCTQVESLSGRSPVLKGERKLTVAELVNKIGNTRIKMGTVESELRMKLAGLLEDQKVLEAVDGQLSASIPEHVFYRFRFAQVWGKLSTESKQLTQVIKRIQAALAKPVST